MRRSCERGIALSAVEQDGAHDMHRRASCRIDVPIIQAAVCRFSFRPAPSSREWLLTIGVRSRLCSSVMKKGFPMKSSRLIMSALIGAAFSFTAQAQGYPEKTVRVVVPFPAGGAADIVARHVTTRLSAVIGQQIIVDNRGGAGGMIGAENASRSPADGYNLLFASSSVLSINPHLGARASYDVLKSFTPIVKIGDAPNVLTVHPSVPAKTVRDLIAIAKSRPGALAYASNGSGTLSHLTGELFSQRAGINMLHVPYKGAAHHGWPAG